MTTNTNPTETLHTLDAMEAALGPATLEEALAQVESHDKATLIHKGKEVATPRIETDAARMYGIAFDFLGRATDEQLDHLPAMSREWLRVAVWTANEGGRRYRALNGQQTGEATRQAASAADAAALQVQVEAKREQLHGALVSIAGGDKALLVKVAGAYGSATAPAKAVRDQAELTRSWRTSGTAGVKDRLGKSRLSDAWLAKAEALADQHTAASTRATAPRATSTWTQADVDHLDGINLELLRSAVAQFEAGHAADPAIPRLTFNSLLSHVHRSHHADLPVTPTVTGGTTPVPMRAG